MDTVATETEDINGMETNHKRESDLLKMLSERIKTASMAMVAMETIRGSKRQKIGWATKRPKNRWLHCLNISCQHSLRMWAHISHKSP